MVDEWRHRRRPGILSDVKFSSNPRIPYDVTWVSRSGVSRVQDVDVSIKPNAFRRLISNLLGNAVRYADNVKVMGGVENRLLTILVDDDGPGIPVKNREDAFRPFVRLDHARNLDETGTGLGLAIALDIAHAHGGEIRLDESPAGGLRAVVQIPV